MSRELSDWDKNNLIANGNFIVGEIGGLPDGWEAICPNEALAPVFKLVETQDGKPALMAAADSKTIVTKEMSKRVRMVPMRKARAICQSITTANEAVMPGMKMRNASDCVIS